MKKDRAYLIIISSFFLSLSSAQAEPDTQHQPMHGQMEEKMFKEADSNADGAISKDEFTAFQSKHFEKMDANSDGKISHEEMVVGHSKQKESGTTHLDKRFDAADTNHDGGLDRTEAEMMPMLTMYFNEVDSNKDNKVTRQEYFDAMPLLHSGKPMKSSGKSEAL